MDDMMWFLLGLVNEGGKVKPLSVTENGTYNAVSYTHLTLPTIA